MFIWKCNNANMFYVRARFRVWLGLGNKTYCLVIIKVIEVYEKSPQFTETNVCVCVCEQWDRWRVSNVNSDYSVCPSYPSAVIVPREVDDDKLIRSARFRQGGRFPVLSYCHHRNGMVSIECFLVSQIYVYVTIYWTTFPIKAKHT